MTKSRILMGGVALTCLMATAACGSREDEAPPPAADSAAPAAADDSAAAEEPAADIVEVEPNGNVIEVQMLTRDPDGSGMQVFRPALIEAEVGDTIRFVPTDPTHQSSSMDGMLPAGAASWEGEVNQPIEYVVSVPGVYGYQCVPHYAAGMVGLIVVNGEGKLDNLEAARGVTHAGLARTKFADLFEQAEADGLLSE